jgi:hypothetical protein
MGEMYLSAHFGGVKHSGDSVSGRAACWAKTASTPDPPQTLGPPGPAAGGCRGTDRVHLRARPGGGPGLEIPLPEEPGDYLAVVLTVNVVDELDALLAR